MCNFNCFNHESSEDMMYFWSSGLCGLKSRFARRTLNPRWNKGFPRKIMAPVPSFTDFAFFVRARRSLTVAPSPRIFRGRQSCGRWRGGGCHGRACRVALTGFRHGSGPNPRSSQTVGKAVTKTQLSRYVLPPVLVYLPGNRHGMGCRRSRSCLVAHYEVLTIFKATLFKQATIRFIRMEKQTKCLLRNSQKQNNSSL